MAEYLDEAGLQEVWSKARDAFAANNHTHNLATTSSSGFLRALSNNSTQFLSGKGTWLTPNSSGLSCTTLYSNTSGASGTITLSQNYSSFTFIVVNLVVYISAGGGNPYLYGSALCTSWGHVTGESYYSSREYIMTGQIKLSGNSLTSYGYYTTSSGWTSGTCKVFQVYGVN